MSAFDVIVIGFGRGRKTLTTELAKCGQKVTVVERSNRMYGGTCINIDCTPTRTSVHQTKVASSMKGLTFLRRRKFYRNAVSVRDPVVGALRGKNYHNLTDNPHVAIYTGFGSLVSSDTISVHTVVKELLLIAKQIIINTGAETAIPFIGGITGNPFVHASTSIMELADLPCHLVIVGGDCTGLELVSVYVPFGSQVTVPKGYPESIVRGDRNITASTKETSEKKGTILRMNTKVQSVSRTSGKTIVTFADLQTSEAFKLEVNAVLLATGHKPNTQGLHLGVVEVEVDAHGAIIVDEYLETTNPTIHTVGDVKDGLQFIYISLDGYRIIRDNLLGDAERKTSDRNPVNYSVFIDPLLTHVGLNEEEARKRDLDITMKRLPVMTVLRAKILGETDGLSRAIIDKKAGLIPGCMLFVPDSGEVINTAAFATKTGQSYTLLHDFIFTHPSMSEASNDLFA